MSSPLTEACAEIRAYQARKRATPLYFVEAESLDRELYFCERNRNDLDRKTTLHLIKSGEWNKVHRVIEVIPEEGTCRDVSEDFAREIADAADEPLRRDLIDFIWRHAGSALALAVAAE